jgi:hypothetical protein
LELWVILVYEDLNTLLENPHPEPLLPPFRRTGAREGVLNDFFYLELLNSDETISSSIFKLAH